MNRITFALAFLLIGTFALAQEQNNYILIIDNDSIPMDLNSDFQYKTPKGEQLNIRIAQPDILTYSDDMISFSHPNSLSVSNSAVDEGIDQCMIVKSTGSGYMIQKFRTLDPSSLTRLMLNEIIKESINYGYTKTEKDFSRTLKSGQIIEGVEATLTYKGEEEIYTVASYGGKDEGIIVITMLLSDEYSNDQDMIDLFLDTLEIKESR